MSQSRITRRRAVAALAGGGAVGLVAGCADNGAGSGQNKPEPLQLNLDDPIDLAYARQKVIGSVAEEEIHSFLRFHFYGQVPGEKARPLFSMNNYIVDQWTPVERGTYRLRHWEVGYYCAFDTDEPIETWLNPYTKEELEVFQFVLGPIEREYSPDSVLAPGLAPIPLTSHVMGPRFYVATEAISQVPNLFQPEEWPQRSSGKMANWVSLQTISALMEDIVNPELTSAPSNIHLQNFISWGSWMQMGGRPGGTMARAYGTEIDGFDALPKHVRDGFKKYTPEIFETATWDVTRFDEFDYLKLMQERRAKGEA
ncbi:MAG: DUF1838 domain-containing protein [Gammaproteobacteria bacterium]|nr:DUF1838 domain-containing protein [Gammaproteobacteria bacterium]